MPKGRLKPCKWSSEPETREARWERLDARRVRQRASVQGFFVEDPAMRADRIARERRARRQKNPLPPPLRTRYLLKVGKTYNRQGKR